MMNVAAVLLRTLRVSQNQIELVQPGAFSNLSILGCSDLGSNGISTLDVTLCSLKSIYLIDLSYNQLTMQERLLKKLWFESRDDSYGSEELNLSQISVQR